jgi:hypothetical protein
MRLPRISGFILPVIKFIFVNLAGETELLRNLDPVFNYGIINKTMPVLIKYCSCFFLLFSVNQNFAQDSTRFLIKADQLVSDVLTPERIYQYPKFMPGKIVFRDKTSTEALLNYNYLSGEIEFINPGNDTLAIAKHQMLRIQQILLSKDTFYYHNGYLQQVVKTQLGVLAKRQMLVVFKREKIGAYGQPATTINVESLEYFKDYYGSLTPTLKVRENITMIYKNEFFFGDNYFSFLPANKKNILKLYPSGKAIINDYLRENNVDFNNSGHLQKLFLFIK